MKNITFILGAGASMPYGYPSGEELRTEILNHCNPQYLQQHPDVVDELESIGGFDIELIHDFHNAFLKADCYSIDEFLEGNNPFLEIGKFYITWILIQREDTERLHKSDSRDSTYKYIFKNIFPLYNSIGKNQISFITFNYDLSLEFYLYNHLKYFLRCEDSEVFERRSLIPIIHVHGRLGDPFFEAGGDRYYAGEWDFEMIKKVSTGIQVISDSGHNPLYKSSKYLLTDHPDYVYFLGFGYHPLTIQRLEINEVLDERHGQGRAPSLYGSAMALTTAQIKHKRMLFNGRIQLGDPKHDSVAFLKNNSAFLENLISVR